MQRRDARPASRPSDRCRNARRHLPLRPPRFSAQVATSHAADRASSSLGYRPYVVCGTHPGLSGAERQERVEGYFASTSGVAASQYYADGRLFHNTDARSCGVMRAFNDTVARVYAANAEAADHMSANPLHPSMKMTAGTLTMMSQYVQQQSAGSAVTTRDGDAPHGRMEVQTMLLHTLLCPGVQDFAGEDVPDQQIADDVKGFLAQRGNVAALSFYHSRVDGNEDGADAVYTQRMDGWSEAISRVGNMTKDDESNPCLDSFIEENYQFLVHDDALDVRAKLSQYEFQELADLLGLDAEDVEACYLYLTYGVALSPL